MSSGFVIADGKGKHGNAAVSLNQRLDVSARTATRAFYVSRDDGEAYTWSSEVASANNGDEIIYIKNNSTTLELHIDFVDVSADAASKFCLAYASGTGSGTTLTGVNLNAGSTKTADVTSLGNAAVTGLAIGSRIISGRIPADSDKTFALDNALIIPATKAITVTFQGTNGTAVECFVLGYMESPLN